MRLEWAFRLAQEPRRLAGRYIIGNVTFLAGMVRQKLTGTRI
jgi:alpha-1,3-mannosyltransferase